MRLMPRFQVLVRVFDHDDSGVHHRPDGNGDAAERHDVGIHSLVVHHEESGQHPQRQGHNGYKRRAQVTEKHQADQCDDQKLLDQGALEILYATLDEPRTVVGRYDLNTGR